MTPEEIEIKITAEAMGELNRTMKAVLKELKEIRETQSNCVKCKSFLLKDPLTEVV